MVKRGKIDIRGMGTMTTFYLTANEKASADEILGRKSRVQTQEGVEVTFIDEGKRQYPPPSTRGGTPQLLRNLVTAGHSGDSKENVNHALYIVTIIESIQHIINGCPTLFIVIIVSDLYTDFPYCTFATSQHI